MSRVTIFIGCVILCAGLACAAYDDVLGIKVLTPPENGCRKAKDGDVLKMHYEGKLENGDTFDSSYKRDKPLEFTLGSKSVIEGWEKGLQGICEGEVRELTIPSRMAYGERGAGGVIPPMSTLIFKVELVEFGNASTDEL